MEQVHTPDSDERFIEDVIPILKDPRYIRVNGAPLLIVYRFSLLPDPLSTTKTWREICKKAGLPKIHIAAVQSFGIEDPRLFGCDSAVEFPPHGVSASEITKDLDGLDPDYQGKVFDYRELVAADETRVASAYPVFPCVMPAWDNTARRGARGHVFHHSDPNHYQTWLSNALARAAREPVGGEEMVFINAWNEWAEGAHLEPDRKWGHAYLEATRSALLQNESWPSIAKRLLSLDSDGSGKQLVEQLCSHIRALEASNKFLKKKIDPSQFKRRLEALLLTPDRVALRNGESSLTPGFMYLEQVNLSSPASVIRVPSDSEVYLKGWAFVPNLSQNPDGRETYFALIDSKSGKMYAAPVLEWEHRPDVAQTFANFSQFVTSDSGFSFVANFKGIPSGAYEVAMFERGKHSDGISFAQARLEISH